MSCCKLDKAAIVHEAEKLSFSREIISQIAEYIDRIIAEEREQLFCDVQQDFFSCGPWLNAPEMPDFLQRIPDKELFFLVTALASIPMAKARFAEEDLPLPRLEEGLADIRIWALNCLKNYSIPGLEWGCGLHWIFWRIFTGQVLRFGRLECNKGFSFADVIVLKNREDGRLQAICDAEYALDKDGFITADASRIVRRAQKMKKLFSEIAALPIREDGSVSEKEETFFPGEWAGFLSPGDNVLSLHIPEDGRLDIEECLKSLQQMSGYYSAIGYSFKAFICNSWFLDAGMEKFAGGNSNMVKFRDLGLLIGPASASSDVVRRVFGTAGIDGNAIQKSTLQRNLAEFFSAGGVFRGGRIIIDPASCR